MAVKFIYQSRDVDPVTLTQVRVTLCFLVAGVILGLVRPRLLKIRPADLPFMAFFGLCGITPTQITYYFAIHEASVAVAIFLQFLAPILTSFYEIVIQKRRPGRFTLLTLALAISGAAGLLFGSGGGVAAPTSGILWGLASTFGLAAYVLIGRAGAKRYNPWTMLFWSTAMSSLFWAVVHPVGLVLAMPFTAADWSFFLFLAVFTTFIPFGLHFTGLKYIGATAAVVTATVEPVMATILAALLLGEGVTMGQGLGCALILAAIVALQVLPGAAITDREPSAASPQ